MSSILDLPDEILIDIYKLLNIKDILNLNLCCKRFYDITVSGKFLISEEVINYLLNYKFKYIYKKINNIPLNNIQVLGHTINSNDINADNENFKSPLLNLFINFIHLERSKTNYDLSNLTNVKHMKLYYNIKHVPIEFEIILPEYLKTLMIHYSDLENIKTINNVTHLIINPNIFIIIPDNLSVDNVIIGKKFINLKSLYIDKKKGNLYYDNYKLCNIIFKLSEDDKFKLNTLYLDKAKIDPKSSLSSLSNLETLYICCSLLNYNIDYYCPLQLLQTIKYLYIQYLSDNMISNLYNLEYLEFEHLINFETFKLINMPNLKELKISSYSDKVIIIKNCPKLKSYSYLNIDHNTRFEIVFNKLINNNDELLISPLDLNNFINIKYLNIVHLNDPLNIDLLKHKNIKTLKLYKCIINNMDNYYNLEYLELTKLNISKLELTNLINLKNIVITSDDTIKVTVKNMPSLKKYIFTKTNYSYIFKIVFNKLINNNEYLEIGHQFLENFIDINTLNISGIYDNVNYDFSNIKFLELDFIDLNFNNLNNLGKLEYLKLNYIRTNDIIELVNLPNLKKIINRTKQPIRIKNAPKLRYYLYENYSSKFEVEFKNLINNDTYLDLLPNKLNNFVGIDKLYIRDFEDLNEINLTNNLNIRSLTIETMCNFDLRSISKLKKLEYLSLNYVNYVYYKNKYKFLTNSELSYGVKDNDKYNLILDISNKSLKTIKINQCYIGTFIIKDLLNLVNFDVSSLYCLKFSESNIKCNKKTNMLVNII